MTSVNASVRAIGLVLIKESAGRIASILQTHAESLSDADAQFHADVCVRLFIGLLPLLQYAKPHKRRRAATEYKEVVKRYLRPILKDAMQEAPRT